MVFTMSEKERLTRENIELSRRVKALEALTNFSEKDLVEMDKVLKSCKRIFKTINRGKRALVLGNGAVVNLERFCKSTDKRFEGTYSTAKRELGVSSLEFMSLENDFRCIHHFIKTGDTNVFKGDL